MNSLEHYLRGLFSNSAKIHNIDTGVEISCAQAFQKSFDRSLEIKREIPSSEQRFIYIHEDDKINFIIDFFSVILAGHIATPVVREWGEVTKENIDKRLKPVSEIKNGNIFNVKTDTDRHDMKLPKGCSVALHSSGTTSTPKTILHNIEALIGNAESLASSLENSESDKHLCVLPLSHAHGLGFGMLSSLFLGSDLYLSNFTSPQKWVSDIDNYKITITSLVPPLVKILTEQRRTSDLRTLRYLLVSSSKLSKSTAFEFAERYKTPIAHGWGQSELSNFVTCTPPLEANEISKFENSVSVGFPIHGCDVSLRESMIYVSSPYSCRCIISDEGYSFPGTWHFTGDTGKEDYRGLFIEDRIGDVITRGAIKHSPAQLEDQVARKVSSVKKCVAMRVATQDEEDKLVLYIVLREGVDNRRSVKLQVRESLSKILLPDEIFIGDESTIPRTQTGKVMKDKLAKHLMGAFA